MSMKKGEPWPDRPRPQLTGACCARRSPPSDRSACPRRNWPDKPPSFIGKYELGERRLDIVELLAILARLEQDPQAFLAEALPVLPEILG